LATAEGRKRSIVAKHRNRSSTGFIYRVVRTATHIKTGKKQVSRFGAYRSYAEAHKRLDEDEEAMPMGIPEYDYEYKIEKIATALA
jgi:hypothetical protein